MNKRVSTEQPTKSLAEAVDWIRRAAESGYADAQYELARAYEDGQGLPQSTEEATRWYRKAADGGHADAKAALARILEGGQNGDSKPMRQKAEEGGAEAQYQIGQSHATGVGAAPDYAEAARWFRRAAEQDHAAAQVALGSLHFLGLGVLQDYVEAHMWLNLAVTKLPPGKEFDESVELRDRIGRLLPAAALADAQRRAREWLNQRRAGAPGRPVLDPAALARLRASDPGNPR